ncbi:MAG: hypothetical protein KTR31_08995 [Myxococcales bacterium]|nr:hypothetical protein [Myxococcales bacterium]
MRRLVPLVLLLTHCVGGGSTPETSDPSETPDPSPETTRNTAVLCALVEQDQDEDGLADALQRLAYNDQGELLLDASDSAADGVDNIVLQISFGEELRTTDAQYDLDGDGLAEGSGLTDEVLASGIISTFQFDADSDGTLEADLETLVWTPAGDPEEQRYLQSGAEPERRFHTYDASRRPLTWDIDDGEDGTLDWQRRTTYASGLVEVITDVDADGVDDELTETHTDAMGRVTLVRTDAPLGEPWEIVETYTYDDLGLAEIVRETTFSSTITTTYVRDDQGRTLEEEVARDDRVTRSAWTYVDCAEVL